jgi:hypothetical protein
MPDAAEQFLQAGREYPFISIAIGPGDRKFFCRPGRTVQ